MKSFFKVMSIIFPGIALSNPIIASSATYNCDGETKRGVNWLFSRLYEASAIQLNTEICGSVNKANKLDANSLFLTYGYSKGRMVICISDTDTEPCKLIVGTFANDVDPRKVLKSIFGVEDQVDPTNPINESIERLLIRPAEIIYREPKQNSKEN